MTDPRPTVGNLADIAYASLAPVAVGDDERGWPLLIFLNAFYLSLQQVDDIVRDQPGIAGGWEILFFPYLCPTPSLPWLAMFSGTRIKTGMSEEALRKAIDERQSFSRCTPGALVDALKAAMQAADPTSPARVILRERNDPDNAGDAPGHVTVIMYTSDVGGLTETDLYNAALEQKDVGLLLHVIVRDGQDWQSVVDHNATWQDVIDNFPTWNDLIESSP